MTRKLGISAIALASILTACSGPGTLRVRVNPDLDNLVYVRAYDMEKPYIKRDMLPDGEKGLFVTRFPDDTDVAVRVKVDNGKMIEKTIRVEQDSDKFLEFNIGMEDPDVEFIRLRSNREFKFNPINKTEKQKIVYLSYSDYIGQNLLLKEQIEEHLLRLGYVIASKPDKNTEIFVTINLVDFASAKEVKGVNEFTINKYKFKINIEQRLKGKTIVEEKYAFKTTDPDNISFKQESYPMDGKQNVFERDELIDTPEPLPPAEAPQSPGLLVLLGYVEDDKAAEKPEEAKKEEATDPAAEATAQAGGEKKEEAAPAAGGGGEVASPADAVGDKSFLNTRGALANSVFDYHLYHEEAILEASVKFVNIEPQNNFAISKTITLLSQRLAHIFNL
ncbi:MAG: hypothetical protein HQM12_20275 [SAR324 cluster bacterium]|nr:hypothetical protein [SAR324 cluster bacterium]